MPEPEVFATVCSASASTSEISFLTFALPQVPHSAPGISLLSENNFTNSLSNFTSNICPCAFLACIALISDTLLNPASFKKLSNIECVRVKASVESELAVKYSQPPLLLLVAFTFLAFALPQVPHSFPVISLLSENSFPKSLSSFTSNICPCAFLACIA